MNELHRLKIVHRDIKPNNILLQIMPNGEHVYKLSDFGAARQVEMEDDQFTSICGTGKISKHKLIYSIIIYY